MAETSNTGGRRSTAIEEGTPPQRMRDQSSSESAAPGQHGARSTTRSSENRGANTEAAEARRPGGGSEPTFVGRVRERAGERMTEQKNRATDSMTAVAHVVRETTTRLRTEQHESIAEYVDRGAEQLERFSEYLRNKDAAELWREAQSYARRRPAVFVGSAFVMGLLAARFLKSSSPARSHRPSWQRTGSDREPFPHQTRSTADQQGMA